MDETGFIPSKRYVSQTEIADYAELLADHFDIRRHIKFSHEVSKLEYCDEGYWIIETLKNEDSKKVKFKISFFFNLSKARIILSFEHLRELIILCEEINV